MIAFVQPFGLQSPGGGSRILRALLEDAPQPFVSICTDWIIPPVTSMGEEVHLPSRPSFGRIETTRLRPFLDSLQPCFANTFKRNLQKVCADRHTTGIHALPHSGDFWYAYQVAQALDIPYFLSVHDDIAYTMQGRWNTNDALMKLKHVWQNASERFVISQAMGQEYNQRYGERSYIQVTDGLANVPEIPLARPSTSLRIYFMGLSHHSYAHNFNSLFAALKIVQQRHRDLKISVVCRCGVLPQAVVVGDIDVQVLPWGSEKDVARDMESADLLYMPLPFGEKHAHFSRFSLSTKMITYLGSGLPILYHGPDFAAAGQLLSEHKAALIVPSLETDDVAKRIDAGLGERLSVVQNALELARSQFLLSEQRSKFWNALSGKRSLPIARVPIEK